MNMNMWRSLESDVGGLTTCNGMNVADTKPPIIKHGKTHAQLVQHYTARYNAWSAQSARAMNELIAALPDGSSSHRRDDLERRIQWASHYARQCFELASNHLSFSQMPVALQHRMKERRPEETRPASPPVVPPDLEMWTGNVDPPVIKHGKTHFQLVQHYTSHRHGWMKNASSLSPPNRAQREEFEGRVEMAGDYAYRSDMLARYHLALSRSSIPHQQLQLRVMDPFPRPDSPPAPPQLASSSRAATAASVDTGGDHGGGPEAVFKLVFPFLKWRELLRNCEPVCKTWKTILQQDDVWRPLYDGHLKHFEAIFIRRANLNNFYSSEEFYSQTHQIMVRQYGCGRSYRDIFVLSRRMGSLLEEHQGCGPHSQSSHSRSHGRGNITIRELCTEYYRYVVGPMLATLTQVFDDTLKSERLATANKMKNKLLVHARTKYAFRKPERDLRMEKNDLAKCLGQYLVAASFEKSLDDKAFISSSVLSTTTIGDMTEAIEGITGEELVTLMTVQHKRTSEGFVKECMYRPAAMDWPVNPIDCLSFLIYRMWPDPYETDHPIPSPEARAEFNEAVTTWWEGLNGGVRNLLLKILKGVPERYTNENPLRQNFGSIDITSEILELLVGLPYDDVRKKISVIIWSDLEPKLRDSIFNIYIQHRKSFAELLRNEYQDLYEKNDPESNARVLLDIFLEIPPNKRHQTDSTKLTREYCSSLGATMETAMDNWDQLADSARRNDSVLWDPQTISDLKAYGDKFCEETFSRRRNASQDFCPGIMVERFIYQTLPSKNAPDDYYSILINAQQWLEDVKKFAEKHNLTERPVFGMFRILSIEERVCQSLKDVQAFYLELGKAPSNPEAMRISGNAEKVVTDYVTYAQFIHTREHAMLALIPLLPDLSMADSKRLIYAIFILGCGSNGFSHDHFHGLNFSGIPCPQDDICLVNSVAHPDIFFKYLCSVVGWVEGCGVEQAVLLDRLFGLGIPENIINAMCGFLLERMYHSSLKDTDSMQMRNALQVLRYMVRFCYENPARADIVWDCFSKALQNALDIVNRLEEEDVTEEERSVFQSFTARMICVCIETRALKVIPVLRKMYEGTPFALQVPDLISFDDLVKKINEAPQFVIDSRDYHAIYEPPIRVYGEGYRVYGEGYRVYEEGYI